MDAAFAFMDGLPRLSQERAQHASIMDAMGPLAPERHLCLTDTIPARVAAHDEIQVARVLTDADIERMREHRQDMRLVARGLHATRIFTSSMADVAMREMRDRGEVDDETRRRIMRVKNERRCIRGYMQLLDARVDKHTLPVEAASLCVT